MREPAPSGTALLARAARPPAVSLAGLGSAFPARVVRNAEVAERIGVTPEWIEARTGIRERRIAAPGETLADLAETAGRDALAQAGMSPAELDLVLVATFTADQVVPAAAPLVAHALGAYRAGVMDVNSACTGFLSALSMALSAIESRRAANVLVIGADLCSRHTDRDDKRTAALFGDGAGAAVLTAGGAGAFGPVHLGHDGAGAALLFATRERGLIEMDGQEVFRHAVARMSEAASAACVAAGVGLDEIDLFIFHQANGRILRAVGTRLGLDADRVLDCIGEHGNTSAASVPLALAAADRAGRVRPGDRVLLCAFGAGFTWGATVMTR